MKHEELKKNFESHGFTTHFFETSEKDQNYLVENIQGQSVGLAVALEK